MYTNKLFTPERMLGFASYKYAPDWFLFQSAHESCNAICKMMPDYPETLILTFEKVKQFIKDGSQHCIIELLLREHTEIVNMQHVLGNTLLHVACQMPTSSLQTIQYLILQNPDSVNMCNSGGRIPVELYLSSKRATSLRDLELMSKYAPDIFQLGFSDQSILHWYLYPLYLPTLEVVQWLVRQNPGVVRSLNARCFFHCTEPAAFIYQPISV